MDKPDHKVMTVQKEMKEMDKKMMDAMGDKDKMYDKRFMELMISHHEGGIKMAKDAINNSERSEIKDMAKKIIETQKKEINQMEGWKKSWYQE
ncbi:DUF305 domain-containing protein [Candidatus Berkiella aquae]|nr:DUF305 domain-containing protein [Candidatus Berkiella aquae]